MRFDRIDLTAFGPFTQQSCDLPARERDFYVFHGPNEAGKSSLLRAITALLYGIEPQTDDNFRHNYDQLRLSAAVRAGDTALEFQRRKRAKNTLLTGDGARTLSEDDLKQFLHWVDRHRFRNLYGLNRADLADGGRAIASGEGDIASMLSEAGGLAGARQLLAALDNEAAAIFAPKAKKPLNTALTLHTEAETQKRRSLVTPTREREIRGARDQAAAELEETKHACENARAQIAKLERIRSNHGDLGTLTGLGEQLAAVAASKLLDESAKERRARAETALSEANLQIEQLKQSLGDRGARMAALDPRPKLIANKQEITRCYKGIGGYGDCRRSFEDLKERRKATEAKIDRWLVARRPPIEETTATALLPTLANAGTVRSLLNENTRLTTLEEQDNINESQRSTLEADLARLPAPRDTGRITAALKQMLARGDLEQRLRELQAEAEAADAETATLLQALPGWRAGDEALAQQPCPLLETIGIHRDAISSAAIKNQHAQDILAERTQDAQAANESLQRKRASVPAPAAEDLTAARQQRDSLWDIISRLNFAGTLTQDQALDIAGTTDIPTEYRRRVAEADSMADSRFAAADQIGQIKNLEEEYQRKLGPKQLAEQAAGEAQEHLADCTTNWRAVWARPLPLIGPGEAKQWMAQRASVLEKRGQASAMRSDAQRLTGQIEQQRRELSGLLTELGEPGGSEAESLATLLNRAESVRDRVNAKISERANKQREFDAARQACESATKHQAQRESWQQRWGKAVAQFQPLSLTPENAEELISALAEFSQFASEQQGFSKRIVDVGENIQTFEREVRSLASRFGADGGPAADDCAGSLHDELAKAESALQTQSTEHEESEKEQGRLNQLEAKRRAENDQLQRLCEAAGVASAADLPQAEDRSAQRRQLEKDIAKLEQSLSQRNSGRPLEEISAEASGLDADHVASQLAIAEDDWKNSEKLKETALLEANRTQREWDALSGSQAAAEAAQRSAVALEEVRVRTAEYARLKLCAEALRRGMESYRQQHQAPVLKRAGEAFSRMPLGEFTRLEQDYGKGEHRVLKAVRSQENRSLGHEELSEGTADQLFLAFRLAIIDEHRGPQGGMPLILDEILEGADEQRAAAILNELAEFSKRNQVLLFTHHKHVADLAVSSGAVLIPMPLPEPAALTAN